MYECCSANNVSTSDEDNKDIKIGLLIPFKYARSLGNYYFRGQYYASAMSIAIDDINKRKDLLPGRNISFIWNDTECDELKTLRALAYQINHGVKAFIGPGCSCTTAARSAAAFNLSMISYVSNTVYFAKWWSQQTRWLVLPAYVKVNNFIHLSLLELTRMFYIFTWELLLVKLQTLHSINSNKHYFDGV